MGRVQRFRKQRRRARFVLAGLLCAGVAVAGAVAPLLGTADARKKKENLVGKYRGTSEEGKPVSFRLTRGAKIVDFKLDATLYCFDKRPTGDVYFIFDQAAYTKDVTITHAPMPMRGVSKRHPQGKKWEVLDPTPENAAHQGGSFKGKVASVTSTPDGGKVLGNGFLGEVSYETANGPTPFSPTSTGPPPEWAPGTEWCVTKLFIDWKAKKPGDPGFVFSR